MKILTLARRNSIEIIRDPLTMIFGLGFPVILLILLSAIQANIPVSLFEIQHLAPGICVFGLSFMTLFGATLIAKDRESALLERLYTAPIRPKDFIIGYALPLIPLAIGQSAVCYTVAMLIGLKPSVHIISSLVFIIPSAMLFIGLGLLLGSLLSVKQVGGICGALLTNLTAWFSGVWFNLELVGGTFKAIADALPFVHAVETARCVINGSYSAILPHLLWVTCYAVAVFVLAVVAFIKQMKK